MRPAADLRHSRRSSSNAGPARGWWRGAKRSPGSSAGRSPTRPIGDARCPASAPTRPRVLIVGLAPAAHGANRTGRNFTGDRSGDWLYASLFRTGLANQPTSVSIDDGLTLFDTRVVAAVRCAPPDNKPTPVERDTCRQWLVRELELCWPSVRAVVVLGGFGWAALWPALRAAGISDAPARPQVRARRRSRARGRAHRARLLPREPAEHLHRPPDRAHARRRDDPSC